MTRGTQALTLEDTADERARLANMALADCGLPEVVDVELVDGGRRTTVPRGHVPGRKAVRLAAMHVHGPDTPARCDACLDAGTWDTCERIPVADALRGRTCGKYGGGQ